MFSIERLTLENFKCFRGKHIIEFPVEPGLYFLTGENHKDKSLESNGAGKSTLLDAIYWCLYGKTLRGLKAGDIITWGESTASVELVTTVGKCTDTLKRTQNPNGFYKNGNPVNDFYIESFFGLTQDSFQRSVIMAQFNEPFLSLTPTAKLGVFSQILNLEHWLDYSHKASDAAKKINLDISFKSQQAGGLELAIEAAKQDLSSLERRSDEYADEQKEKVKVAEDELNRLIRVEQEIRDEEKPIIKEATDAEARGFFFKARLARLKDDLNFICDKLNHGQGEYHKSGAEAQQAAKALNAFTIVSSYCPTCMQNVSAAHLKKEIKAAETRLQVATKTYQKAKAVADKLQDRLVEIRADIAGTERDFEAVKLDERKFKGQLENLKYELKQYAERQQTAKRLVEEEAKRPNPYQGQINTTKDKILVYKQKQKAINELLLGLASDLEACEFWVQGFKKLRLMVLEETLTALAVEVNSCITQLGLNDWSIEFDVERENKSGGLTKGFVVLIHAPGIDKPVRWEAWSGGETQRLQLAGDLGLANLIMNQAGLQNTIEFYDEPSHHLSRAGQVDLAEMLSQRALDEGKIIIYVDHNMPDFGDFAGVITVVKNKSGESYVLDSAS